MLCVERDEKGKIVSVGRKDDDGGNNGSRQAVDQEVLDFLSSNSAEDSIFRLLDATDLGIVRVLEDLIDLLVKKNVIMFSELPDRAQKKLLNRQQMRQRIADGSLIIGEEDVL